MAINEVLTRLTCLFEDYTIRRCWPQESGQCPALSVVPSLVFDLSGKKARAIFVGPRSDGRIFAESRKFEKVYLSVSMPNTVQEEVDYSMYRRGQNWAPCALSAIPELRSSGKESVETIWNVDPDEFADLLWGLIRWPIRQAGFQKLFVVSSDDHKQMVKAALETIAQNQSGATVLQGAEVLSRPEHLRGFALLDDPQSPPEEGEFMLLLYSQEQHAELFQWSMDRFTYRQMDSAQTIDLAYISRLAACLGTLEQPPKGVLLFHSLSELDNHAIAHYVMWQLALYQWSIERKLRQVQQLQRRIAQLKRENEDLERTVRRANRVLEELQANPSFIKGDVEYASIRN